MNAIQKKLETGALPSWFTPSFFRENGLPAGYRDPVKAFLLECNKQQLPPGNPSTFLAVMDHFKEQVRGGQLAASSYNLRLTATRRAIETWAVSGGASEREKENLKKIMQTVQPVKIQDKGIRSADCYSPEELLILREVAGDRTRLLLELLQVTGCRVSELINIELAALKKKGGCYAVKVLGKGDKQRTVFIPSGIVQECKTVFKGKMYLLETGKQGGKHTGGKKYSRNQVAIMLKEAGKQAAKKVLDPARVDALLRISPHKLRHSWATNALKGGMDLVTVSRYLGHSSVEVTAAFYDHREITPDDVLNVYTL